MLDCIRRWDKDVLGADYNLLRAEPMLTFLFILSIPTF